MAGRFLNEERRGGERRGEGTSVFINVEVLGKWAGHVARVGKRKSVYWVLVGKPEGKRRLGRPRHRWEGNIKKDVQEKGCGCMDWTELAQDRDRWRALVNAVIKLRVL